MTTYRVALFLSVLATLPGLFSETPASASPCSDSDPELWVSPGLFAERFGKKMDESLQKVGRKLEERDLSQSKLEKDLKFPVVLLQPQDRPSGAPSMVPSKLKIDGLDLSTAKFGKAIIQPNPGGLGSRQRVRVPIENLQLQSDLSLACREGACAGRELLGFQGLAVSISEANAGNQAGPFFEFDLEMGAADAALLEQMKTTLGSPEFLRMKKLLDSTTTEEGLRKALDSDEMWALDQRVSGIGERMTEHFTTWCSGKDRPFAPMTSQEFSTS